MSSPEAGANIDSALLSACRASGLSERHIQLLVFQLSIRRLEHFFYAKPKDLQSIGLSDAEVNRLREAVAEAQRSMQQDGQTFVRKDNSLHVQGLDSKHFINSTQIQLMDIIGEGTFAIVRRGIWTRPDGRRIDVAVKILRDMSSIMLEEVRTEASHLLKLQHPNLICMFGICQHPTMMVFELCEGGSLLDRLRDTAKLVPLVSTLLDYCTQIVKALAYLEKQRCVHRDVAARNILLSKGEKVVKVCDFGLMRNLKENEEMYVMGPQKKVPFSWCPPESLRHRKFSHASDVFAFGVTMWEIFSLGEEPWIGCRAIEVLKRLDAGERLEKPAHCSQQIYDLCLLCWKLNPDSRPRFNLLRNFLKEAEFNIAEVRESVPGSGDRPLKLDVGDRVIVIENTGVMWYGQNERTRQFGTFPRSCVYVHSKTAIAPAPTSPQIIAATTSAPLRPALPPSGSIPATFMSSQQNSRISLPIQGSFIHAGHGDPRTGQTWGDPSRIDSVYLKNPVIGQPITLMNGATLVPSVHDLNSRSSSNTVTPSPKVGTSLFIKPIDYVDPFDAAQRDCFSPSKIELPKFDGNVAPSNGFAASTSVPAVDRRSTAFSISARQSPPFHPTPSAAVSTIPAIPPPPTRTASVSASSSSATAAAANLPHPMASHSFVPSSQPVRFSQLPKDNPLVSEMKERLAVVGMGAGTAQSGQMHASASDPFFGSAASKTLDIRQPQSSSSSTSALSSACLIPTPIPPPAPAAQPVKLPVTQPIVPSSQAPVSFRQHPVFSSHQQHQSVAVPTPAPSATIPIAVPSTSSSASAQPTQKPTPPSTLQQPQKVALPRPQSTSIKPSSSSGLPPPPTTTSADRRSIIEKEVSSLLPPPSALLFGSNPTSNASTVLSNTPTPSTSQSALVKSPSVSQNTEIKKNATPVPASLPVVQPTPTVAPLSLSSVLVPTPLPQAHNSSATVVALETGDKRQSQLTDDDISNLIASFERTAQSQPASNLSARTTPTQVPIFALSDSTRCSTVALQGAQYQYQYGMMGMTPYHNNFYGWNVPNGYWNGDGMAAMAQSSIYPPIAYNPASIVAQNSTVSSGGSSNGITRAEEMEILYKEASFTDRSRCDAMMRECKGDTEEALKQLKMGYLQIIGLAKDATAARVALTRHEWNLNAAAESLL